MDGVSTIAEILKREQVQFLTCFPANPLIEASARIGIRPIVCRQERVGVGIADGFSRIAGRGRVGVCAVQYGPGAENAFPGIAQAFADSVPILVIPTGEARRDVGLHPNFSATRAYAPVTKWVEHINLVERIPDLMRRAFTLLRSGRPGPVALELPIDVAIEEYPGELAYQPVAALRSAGDPNDVDAVAQRLVAAARPVLHAGQGVLYSEATDELHQLAELLQAPVMTTLPGKGAFDESHPLSLGAGGLTTTLPVHEFLQKADVVFGIGCSFSRSLYATPIPAGKAILHTTADPADVNKVLPTERAIVGDTRLVLRQLLEAVRQYLPQPRDGAAVSGEIAEVRARFFEQWKPKLTSDERPVNPYRVIWDLMAMVDRKNVIVTADAGSSRNYLGTFWQPTAPRTYIGWGKSTQLGHSLGLAMGAKLAAPERLSINIMGDAAFGMVGMDFETAVRSGIPILTIVLNNFAMASEKATLAVATQSYGTHRLSGNFAGVAKELGGYSEQVDDPAAVAPALRRAIGAVQDGRPALLEVLTCEEPSYSRLR